MRLTTAALLLALSISIPACASTGGGMPPELRNALLIGIAIEDYSETGDAAGMVTALSSVLNVPGGSMLTDLVQVYDDYKLTGDQHAARVALLAVLGFESILLVADVEPDPLILMAARRLMRDHPELDADLVARLLTARMGIESPSTALASGAGTSG